MSDMKCAAGIGGVNGSGLVRTGAGVPAFSIWVYCPLGE